MIVQIHEASNPEEAKQLTNLGVDHVGILVGTGKFPRELNFEEAKKIFKALPKEAKGVALTLDWKTENIIRLIEEAEPDILQIGTFLENFLLKDVQELKNLFPDLKIMRAIPVVDEEIIKIAKSYDGVADYLLLDTYKKGDCGIGATGNIHDWNISQKIVKAVKIPVILAGGLGPDNVAEAIKKVRPAGVNSKTKTDRINGEGKDLEKVKEFVKIAKGF
jgi:phosphoribosylanthranilate isomerase